MGVKQNEIFELMQCAFRNGVVDRFTSIQSRALMEAMNSTGMNLQDLLNLMDDSKVETIGKIDRRLDKAGPFIKYAANDRLMKFIYRLMNIPLIERQMVRSMKRSLLNVMTGTPPASLSDRIKSVFTSRFAAYGGMKNG